MLRFGKPVKLLLVNRLLEDWLLPRLVAARPISQNITVICHVLSLLISWKFFLPL